MFYSLANSPDNANRLHYKDVPVHKYWTHAPNVFAKQFGTIAS